MCKGSLKYTIGTLRRMRCVHHLARLKMIQILFINFFAEIMITKKEKLSQTTNLDILESVFF